MIKFKQNRKKEPRKDLDVDFFRNNLFFYKGEFVIPGIGDNRNIYLLSPLSRNITVLYFEGAVDAVNDEELVVAKEGEYVKLEQVDDLDNDKDSQKKADPVNSSFIRQSLANKYY